MDYLNSDWEQYFHILKEWKRFCEKDFLEQRPHLREPNAIRKFVYITRFKKDLLHLSLYVFFYYSKLKKV